MDYEQKYKEALERIRKYQGAWINKDGNEFIQDIFPELKESDIRSCIGMCLTDANEQRFKDYNTSLKDCLAWLEKQGEQKPDWNEYDMVVINAIYNTLKHCGVTKCGLEVTEMLEWLEELEKQGKRNNIVEQLTAFAVHLQKHGAFRDDLCMDFEHEAQSFIEMQKK